MCSASARMSRRPTWPWDRGSRPILALCSKPPKSQTALRLLGLEGQHNCVELFTRSAGDYLDQWFERDPIKAILGFVGIVGTYSSPYAAGTGYVPLHHCWAR